MISDPKTQDRVVALMILVGVISAVSLVNTASYYSGSYYLLKDMQVELLEIRLSNLDIDNHTVDPVMRLTFRFQAPYTFQGNIQITGMSATVFLNRDKLSYTAFGLSVPEEYRLVSSGYTHEFTLSSTVHDINDKFTVYNASVSSSWVFAVRLQWSYRMFATAGMPRSTPMVVDFNRTGVVLD